MNRKLASQGVACIEMVPIYLGGCVAERLELVSIVRPAWASVGRANLDFSHQTCIGLYLPNSTTHYYASLRFILLHHASLASSCFTMLYSAPLCFIMLHYSSWCFIILHQASLCFIKLHYASLCFIMLHQASLASSCFISFIMHHCPSLCFMVLHCASSCFTMLHWASLCFITLH